MAAALRSKIGLLLAKVESAYGTDPTPSNSADAIIAYDIEVSPETDAIEREDISPSMSRLKELGGKRRCKISFECEIRGSGAAGTAPKGLSGIMKAAGHAETVVASTSVTYALRSSSFESCTIWVYMDGLLVKITGVVGSTEFSFVAGQTAKIKFEGSGLYNTPTDAAVASPTFDTTVPVVCKNLTATFDSYAAVIRELTLKTNNKIAERANLASIHGIAGFDITGRNPEGEIIIDAVLLATKNFYTKFEADTVQALSLVLGGTAGNICTVTASQCRLRNIPYGDEDGILTHPLPFQMARSSANDEYSIALT